MVQVSDDDDRTCPKTYSRDPSTITPIRIGHSATHYWSPHQYTPQLPNRKPPQSPSLKHPARTRSSPSFFPQPLSHYSFLEDLQLHKSDSTKQSHERAN